MDPGMTTQPIVADVQAMVGPAMAPTASHARAEAVGMLQSMSQAGGVNGTPNVSNPSIVANAMATQSSAYIVEGLPAGTPVAIDLAMMLRGSIATRNFGSPNADLIATVTPSISLTNSAGYQAVGGIGSMNRGMLTTSGIFGPSDFVLSPNSTPRTPHYDVDMMRTVTGAFNVTAGEAFTIDASLWTVGFAEGAFELYSTSDFFSAGNGMSYTLSAPGATVTRVDTLDLSLSRTGFNGPVIVGDTVSYTLTVTNNGPNAATGVVLTDTLLDGLTLLSATPSQGTYDGNEQMFVYNMGNLLSGQSATVEVIARCDREGQFDRTASVTCEQTDSDETNNMLRMNTVVERGTADLVVDLRDMQDPVRRDRAIPYTITVTNWGPDTATGVDVVQSILEGAYSSASRLGDLSIDGRRITFHLPPIAPLTSVTIQTSFYAYPDPWQRGTSFVSVSGDQTDPSPNDCFDQEVTTLTAPSPPRYEYTLIAAGDVGGEPSINSSGVVSYTNDNGAVPGVREIQTDFDDIDLGTAAPIMIAQQTDPVLHFGLYQTINDAGTVAFVRYRSDFQVDDEGIYTGSGGAVRTVAEESASGPYHGFGLSPSINNSGHTAFMCQIDADDQAIMLEDGSGNALAIAATTDPVRQIRRFGHAAINNRDQVAFFAEFEDERRGIFLWDSGTLSLLVDSSGPIEPYLERVSMNDAGVIAFQGRRDDGESGIYLIENGVVRPFVESTGPFREFGFSCPAINNSGMVAFAATLDSGLTGIFTGPDPDEDRVIVRGAALNGSTMTLALVDWQGLNDAGQIAFWALCSNGSTVIARAELMTQDERFIHNLYRDLLDRLASPAEVAAWVQWMQPLGSGGVATAIATSTESHQRQMKQMYQSILGRTPDGVEEMGWVAMLDQGTSAEIVASQLLASAEFATRANVLGGMGNDAMNYASALYQVVLQRTPAQISAADVAGWTNQMNAGVSRADIALGFLNSQEFRAAAARGFYGATTGVTVSWACNLLKRGGNVASAEIAFWATGPYDVSAMQTIFASCAEYYDNA